MLKRMFFGVVLSMVFFSSAFCEDQAEEISYPLSSLRNAASDLMSHIHLEGNESILDVGCGEGKITAKLAEAVPQGNVLGIDISTPMISSAKSHYFPGKHANLSFTLKDGMTLDFEEQFDLIVSFTSLQCLKDHFTFLQGASKSLKTNGKIATSFPLGLPPSLETATQDVMSREKWKEYFHNFSSGWNYPTSEEFQTQLSRTHFRLLYCKTVDQKDVFPSKQIFKNFLCQWFPYLRPVPNDLKDIFMTELIDHLIELSPLDANQCLHFEVKRLEIIAIKDDDS